MKWRVIRSRKRKVGKKPPPWCLQGGYQKTTVTGKVYFHTIYEFFYHEKKLAERQKEKQETMNKKG